MASSQTAWGLDIGTTSLKAIKLAHSGESVTVEAFDVIEHEKFLSEPDVDKDAIVRVSLGKFLERNGVKSDPLFLGVPGSQTFARFVKLPPVEPKKIPEIVKFEAIQQIPFPLEQVNWDYKTFQNPDSPDVEVGIFAMKKELVAQVLSNFRLANKTVAGVQMSPLAVFNAVEFDGMTDGKGTVVLDIGAEHTDLIFVDHGRLWLRTINIGGNNFTDALAKSFRLSFHKAEDLKKTAATSKYARQVYQSMRPVFADLVTEIQRSIGFYNSSHRDSRLERVIGMGNPFKLPNLQKYLAQNLSIEVIRLESFKKATAEGKLAAGLNENVLGMPAAYGLALQGLDLAQIDTDLLPVEIARQMLWKKKHPWFAAAAALIVIGVGVAAFKTQGIDKPAFAAAEKSEDYQKNSAALDEIATLSHKYSEISNTYDNDLTQVLSFVNLSNDRAIWPNLVNDIFVSLPQADPAVAATLQSLPRNERKEIFITSMTTTYSTSLDSAGAPAAPGGTATAAPSTHGFTVTITGYTPLSLVDAHGSRQARVLIRHYLETICDRALPPSSPGYKPNPARPFFYKYRNAPPPYVEKRVGIAAAGGSADLIWGAQATGPYAAAFTPELLGIKPETQPAPVGPGGLPPVDVVPPPVVDHVTTPVEPGGASMIGDDIFTMQFDIYLTPVQSIK